MTKAEGQGGKAAPLPWRSSLAGLCLGGTAFGFLRLAAQSPETTDRLYSRGLYPRIEGGLSALSRWAGFSLGEVLLIGLVVGILLCLLLDIRGSRRRRGPWWEGISRWGLRVLGIAGLGYALFVGLWGLNHARQPYAVHAGLEVQGSDSVELIALMMQLVHDCNDYGPGVTRSSLVVEAGDTRVDEAYGRLVQHVPALDTGRRANLRQPWISPLLSALGIAGIYSPFTGEAHVNGELPLASQPFTACHEEAHGRGFAREDEANFIAWQACRSSTDAAFLYSGSYVALGLVHRALARTQPDVAAGILLLLDPLILEERGEAARFWRSRRTRATAVAERTNDLYLKSQGQADGTASYGRMVDLMLAEQRGRGPNPGSSGEPARVKPDVGPGSTGELGAEPRGGSQPPGEDGD